MDWFAALREEEMQPAEEDMRVLQKVADRILIEFRLEKERISQPLREYKECFKRVSRLL